MKKILSVLLITTYVLCFSQSKKAKKLSEEYLKVAHKKYDKLDHHITKWENADTLKYFVKGEFQYMSDKSWKNFILEIENITNLKIVETTIQANSNMLIYFGDKLEYFDFTNNLRAKKLHTNGCCHSGRKYNSEYYFTYTNFCIDTKRINTSQKGKYYLIKQFIMCLGLLGESEKESSLFYKVYKNNGTGFFKEEKKILRIHYNKKIKAGMSIDQTAVVLKDSIDLERILKEKL